MHAHQTDAADAAELERLIAEQRADESTTQQWPEHRRSASLDTPVFDEHGNESGSVGTDLIGYDPRVAIDDALDTGLDPLETPDVFADSTRVATAGTAWLPNRFRDKVWDTVTIIASRHPYADTEQFVRAYGSRGRRRPNSSRVAPAIVTKLFACIVVAVGNDATLAASRTRGRPTTHDRHARRLAALAVQTLGEMGYASTALAKALALPPSTISRYSNPELLPVLSPEAWERIFGGSPAAAAADSEPTSVLGPELDATRGRFAPAPASLASRRRLHAEGLDQMNFDPTGGHA